MGNQVSANFNSADLKENEKFLQQFRGRVQDTENCRLVQKNWYDALNRRNIRAVRKFVARDAQVFYLGTEIVVPLHVAIDGCVKICESFPDSCIWFDEIEEIENGIVKVSHSQSRGRHTGAPYAYGAFPPVPTSGLSIEEDPFDLLIHLSRGKVTKMEVDRKNGPFVGPPGFYMRIGGKVFGNGK